MTVRRTRLLATAAGLVSLAVLATACSSDGEPVAEPSAAAPLPTVSVSSVFPTPTPAPSTAATDKAAVRVVPDTDLRGGQVVTATATGFTPATRITIAICPTGRKVTGPADCGRALSGNQKTATADSRGSATVQLTVPQGSLGNTGAPKALCPPCSVTAFTPDTTQLATTRLRYAPVLGYDVIPDQPLSGGPLPAGLVPATASRLVGTWVPLDQTKRKKGGTPQVTFRPDRTWTGSDGCNAGGGGWALGELGAFRATSGPMTLIGCRGRAVPGWVSIASVAAFNGEQLVLIDRADFNPPKREIHRLVRK